MLVNFQHLFNATVQEDCTHQRLKDVAKNFGRLKQFDLSPIDQEVAAIETAAKARIMTLERRLANCHCK